MYCLKKLRTYLLGSEFVVYTDHKPLLSLFKGEVANTRIQRWAVLIAEFGARIRHRPWTEIMCVLTCYRAIRESKEVSIIDAAAEMDHS